MIPSQATETLHPWLASARPQSGPRWLQDLRERGASRFSAVGFPTVRDEEWRFTNIAPIANTDFRPADTDAPLSEQQLGALLYADAPYRLVVVNGRFRPELSRTHKLPGGVRAGSLARSINSELEAESEIVQRYLGQLADVGARAFDALNTARIDDGAFVHVSDGTILEQPLQVMFVSTGRSGGHPSIQHPRLLLVVGSNSQVRIVETYVGTGGAYFSNAVTEVFVGENAVVDHYKVQEESREAFHIASMHVHALRSASFSSHSFTLGGRIVRNDVVSILDGEGAECTLNGLYLADGDRLVDNHTTIEHAKAHCPSHEIYKGILGGRARAVFNGKIIVRPDAQKTDAKQTNRALLLSDSASINTKPQLEIFADDVKCTHGAAIGQIDDDALFYLRARGLTFEEARDMLIHAFAGEILDRVRIDALRGALEGELYAQLAKDLAEADAG
ncbi:MAG: Fe-S cluster assembly protein SufD [Vicinamibacterales bacterium]|jgi:Fe-S cluster assembly protein SufD